MEENLRRIVSETSRLCRERDVKADVYLIAYMACLQEVRKAVEAVAPGATLLSPLEPQQVAALSQLLTKLLGEKDSPVLSATRMQVNMEVVFKQQRELVEKEQAERQERVDMAARAVTGMRTGAAGAAGVHDKMNTRVLEYVCTAAGMDMALQDEGAMEEVRAALSSVFPLSSIARFLTLTEEQKLEQMGDLARITLGVCLFNRAVGRGGLALPPGTATYLPQAQRLLRDIGRHVAESREEVEGCAGLMRLYAPRALDDGGWHDDPQNAAQRERAQAEAIHKAQVLLLYEGLAIDLRAGLEAVAALDAELEHLLLQIQDSVGGATAVPKEVVFPMFDRLGAIHQALHEELRLLVVRQRLADELGALTGGYVTLLQRMAKTRRPGRKTAVEEELVRMRAELAAGVAQGPPSVTGEVEYVAPTPRSSTSQPPASEPGSKSGSTSGTRSGSAGSGTGTGQRSGSAGSGAAGASAGVAKDGDDPGLQAFLSSLALSGFDPMLLVKQGQLRRAVPALGSLRFEGVQYGFASHQTMADFAADPKAALAGVMSVVVRQPVLARLLDRTAAFPVLDLHTVVAAMSQPLKVDFGCQTPVHFVERHIDHSYEWNAWALRRRALALANLRQKRTHSTQTALTHFKRDAEAQVWQPKDAVVQTRVNKGQTMPKKLQYVAGLRGAPETKMNVVRLELELGQPHQF